jgi:ATP-dependent Clp protease ATP-binding subunit ClpC
VGKTYLVKLLAKAMDRDLLYLTMSEYMDGQDIKKLTGAGPGYIGYGDPCFVDKVIAAVKKAKAEGRRAPVILFDEMEKADKKVLKTLMQVLDNGQMESSMEDVAYFRDCMIMMTSNIAQKELIAAKKAGASKEEIDDIADKALSRELDPEIKGRINKKLVFNTLTETGVKTILQQQIDILSQAIHERDKHQQGYDLAVDDSMRAKIIKDGYSLETGARQVKDCMTKYLHDPLVEKVHELRTAENPVVIQGGKMVASWSEQEKKPHFEFTPLPQATPTPAPPPSAPAPEKPA